MDKAIEEEGKRYCLKHGSHYGNPYPLNSSEYNSWDRGWSQTLRRFPEKVARIDKQKAKYQASVDKQNQKKIRDSANKYKKLRG